MGRRASLAEARDRLCVGRRSGCRAVKREQWERLKTLFTDALDQPPERRAEWVARRAADDEMLAREVTALLEAHDVAEGFLETPPIFDPAEFAGVDEPAGGPRGGNGGRCVERR